MVVLSYPTKADTLLLTGTDRDEFYRLAIVLYPLSFM